MKTLDETLGPSVVLIKEKYDFSNAVYSGALNRITGVRCKVHGVFSQYAAQFRRGKGCPKCGYAEISSKLRFNSEDYFAKFKLIHGDRYVYEDAYIPNMNTHINVVCKLHGVFRISASKHYYRKQGCPQCGSLMRGKNTDPITARRATADSKLRQYGYTFERDAIAVHGDRYEYANVVYKGRKEKVQICCALHGDFWQTPEMHLHGQGCPQCSHHLSKAENEIAEFVSSYTEVQKRRRDLIPPKELDIYLPEFKIAIEYCGMYWHAAFTKNDEQQQKNRHAEKYQLCKHQGIRLFTIYEYEWKHKSEIIKRVIANAIGITKQKIHARKCSIKKVSYAEAAIFFDLHHIQGGSGFGEHYGLYYNGNLVACMRFAYGVNDRGTGAAFSDWTLARYTTSLTVVGGASKLFTAFIREHNPDCVKSFCDYRYFTGDVYPKLGFKLDIELPVDYQVWDGKHLYHKSKYQRRELPKRILECQIDDVFDPKSDPRTEAEITYMLGAGRIYDCGKARYIWYRK